jgi:hypothetical protein
MAPQAPARKRPDTVGQPQSVENYASHMPSLKAREYGKSEALKAAVSHGRRLTNSIRPFSCLRGFLLVLDRFVGIMWARNAVRKRTSKDKGCSQVLLPSLRSSSGMRTVAVATQKHNGVCSITSHVLSSDSVRI